MALDDILERLDEWERERQQPQPSGLDPLRAAARARLNAARGPVASQLGPEARREFIEAEGEIKARQATGQSAQAIEEARAATREADRIVDSGQADRGLLDRIVHGALTRNPLGLAVRAVAGDEAVDSTYETLLRNAADTASETGEAVLRKTGLVGEPGQGERLRDLVRARLMERRPATSIAGSFAGGFADPVIGGATVATLGAANALATGARAGAVLGRTGQLSGAAALGTEAVVEGAGAALRDEDFKTEATASALFSGALEGGSAGVRALTGGRAPEPNIRAAGSEGDVARSRRYPGVKYDPEVLKTIKERNPDLPDHYQKTLATHLAAPDSPLRRSDKRDVEREVDDLGMYSALHHAANRRAGTRRGDEEKSAEEILNYLRKQPDVKEEEIEWSGLKEFLAGKKGRANFNEVESFLRAQYESSESSIRLEQTSRGGGDSKIELANYGSPDDDGSEVASYDLYLVTSPEDDPRYIEVFYQLDPDEWPLDEMTASQIAEAKGDPANLIGVIRDEVDSDLGFVELDPDGDPVDIDRDLRYALGLDDAAPDGDPVDGPADFENIFFDGGKRYRENLIRLPERADGASNQPSPHFQNYKNVLIHIRQADYEVPGVGDVTLVGEMQSDWHQEAAKGGGYYTQRDAERVRQQARQARAVAWGEEMRRTDRLAADFQRAASRYHPARDPNFKPASPTGAYPDVYDPKDLDVALRDLRESVDKLNSGASKYRDAVQNNTYRKEDFGEYLNEVTVNFRDRVRTLRDQIRLLSRSRFRMRREGGKTDDLLGFIKSLDELSDRYFDVERSATRMFADAEPSPAGAGEPAMPSGVLDAPFKGNNWRRLALKRVVADAVARGQDAVAFPRTRQQVARMEGWPSVTVNEKGDLVAGSTKVTGVVRQYERELPLLVEKFARRYGGEVSRAPIGDTGAEGDFLILKITDDMREKVKEGLPRFKRAEQRPGRRAPAESRIAEAGDTEGGPSASVQVPPPVPRQQRLSNQKKLADFVTGGMSPNEARAVLSEVGHDLRRLNLASTNAEKYVEQLAGIFGSHAVFFDPLEGGKPSAGFTFQKRKPSGRPQRSNNVIYINKKWMTNRVDDRVFISGVVAHEGTHILEVNAPEMHLELSRAFQEHSDVLGDWAGYMKREQEAGASYPRKEYVGEGLANALEETFRNPAFIEHMMLKSEGATRATLEILNTYQKRLFAYVYGGHLKDTANFNRRGLYAPVRSSGLVGPVWQPRDPLGGVETTEMTTEAREAMRMFAGLDISQDRRAVHTQAYRRLSLVLDHARRVLEADRLVKPTEADRFLNEIAISRGVRPTITQRAYDDLTPKFIKQFGDSVITDTGEPVSKGGKPLVLFHGTSSAEDFVRFKTNPDAHFGAHFSVDPGVSAQFSGSSYSADPRRSGRIYPVMLNIKNPLRLPDLGGWEPEDVYEAMVMHAGLEDELRKIGYSGFSTPAEARKAITELGYDGVVYLNRAEIADELGRPIRLSDAEDAYSIDPVLSDDQDILDVEPSAKDSYIAFKASQIKSVFNDGNFRGTTGDIRRKAASAPDDAPDPAEPSIEGQIANETVDGGNGDGGSLYTKSMLDPGEPYRPTVMSTLMSRLFGDLIDRVGSVRADDGRLISRMTPSAAKIQQMARSQVDAARKWSGRMYQELDAALRASDGVGRPVAGGEGLDAAKSAVELQKFQKVEANGSTYLLSPMRQAIEKPEVYNRLSPHAKKTVDRLRDLIHKRGKLFEEAGLVRYVDDDDGNVKEVPFKAFRGEADSTPAPRVPTAEYFRIITSGNPRERRALIRATAHASGKSVDEVEKIFNGRRDQIISPISGPGSIRKAQAEFFREVDDIPDAIVVGGRTIYLTESNPFNYARRLAETGSDRLGFIEVFGQKPKEMLALRTEYAEDSGDPELFDQLFRAMHGAPVDVVTSFQRSSLASVMVDQYHNLFRVIRALRLSASAVPNFTEFAGNMRAFGGNRQTILAAYRLLSPGATERKAALESIGGINRDLLNMSWDPRRPVESVSRIFSNGLNRVTNKWINEFQEMMAAQIASQRVDKWRKGINKGAGDRVSLEALGFTPEQAQALVSGEKAVASKYGPEAVENLYGNVIRRAAAQLTAGNMRPAELSKWEHNRIIRSTVFFQRYAMMKARSFSKQTKATARVLDESLRDGDFKSAAQAMSKWANYQAGTAAAGATGVTLAAVFYGGTDRAASMLVEAGMLDDEGRISTKEPAQRAGRLAKFLGESWAYAAVAGPYGTLLRSLGEGRNTGIVGATEPALQMIAPISIAMEVEAVVRGQGRYSDYEANSPMAWVMLVKNQTPLLRTTERGVLSQLAFTMGFGEKENYRRMRNARTRFWQWAREHDRGKFVGAVGYRDRDEREERFWKGMRKSYAALINADEKGFKDHLIEALPAAKDGMNSLIQSLSNRQILMPYIVTENDTPEEADEKRRMLSSMRNTIGEPMMNRLMEHDMMLEMWITRLREARDSP